MGQSSLRLLHFAKVEVTEYLVHQCRDAVVAQVADASLMGVVDIMVGTELASLYLQSHFLIGIAERHAVGGEAVHLLDGENRVVHGVVEDMLVHLHLVYDICRHVEAVLQFVECW